MRHRHFTLTDNFISTGNAEAAGELIEFYKNPNIEHYQIANLAKSLALSGSTFTPTDDSTADVASTGGPSSLSTLLCPLYLNELGFKVISLGVPGRPAGGVDVLAQIPGYRIEFTQNEVKKCLNNCGYVHFLANAEYAPADARLFKIRQESGSQDVPALVTASLLSKKLAVGVKNLGLDIRISPYGNFGRTWSEGRANADLFCKVSDLLGIKSKCFLTDGEFPYQPYIGRGESLLALSKLFGSDASEKHLTKHSQLCLEMSRSLSRNDKQVDPHGKTLYSVFKKNLISQGASVASFENKIEDIKKEHSHHVLRAEKSGFLAVDLSKVRSILVTLQKVAGGHNNLFADPAGIILKKTTGDLVEKGEVIMSVRNQEAFTKLNEELLTTVNFTSKPSTTKRMEIIQNA